MSPRPDRCAAFRGFARGPRGSRRARSRACSATSFSKRSPASVDACAGMGLRGERARRFFAPAFTWAFTCGLRTRLRSSPGRPSLRDFFALRFQKTLPNRLATLRYSQTNHNGRCGVATHCGAPWQAARTRTQLVYFQPGSRRPRARDALWLPMADAKLAVAKRINLTILESLL